jgi:hypothetical protein
MLQEENYDDENSYIIFNEEAFPRTRVRHYSKRTEKVKSPLDRVA